MHARHVTASLAALAAVALPIAGCGGSSSNPVAAQSSPASKPKPSGGEGSLTISNFKFSPAALTVSKGTPISVANRDGTEHTVTADDGSSFNTDVNGSSSATFTVSRAGTYKYHCSIHPFMHGTLVVK